MIIKGSSFFYLLIIGFVVYFVHDLYTTLGAAHKETFHFVSLLVLFLYSIFHPPVMGLAFNCDSPDFRKSFMLSGTLPAFVRFSLILFVGFAVYTLVCRPFLIIVDWCDKHLTQKI